ncbi:DUF3817 domain-containing protein [Parapedobacter sp. DT-150]|uniref:DUF3817 domain-containing protein n=1 Tax=Parapedobacter sp. DT-150 TaxID=3396162 RepID=UPI003F1B1B15
MTNKQTLNWFCNIALIEGLSLIVLLTFSVLKRTTDYTWAVSGVQNVGMVHGLLFIAYVYLLWACTAKYGWTWRRVVLFLVASIIPFAPFFVEKKLKQERRA